MLLATCWRAGLYIHQKIRWWWWWWWWRRLPSGEGRPANRRRREGGEGGSEWRSGRGRSRRGRRRSSSSAATPPGQRASSSSRPAASIGTARLRPESPPATEARAGPLRTPRRKPLRDHKNYHLHNFRTKNGPKNNLG